MPFIRICFAVTSVAALLLLAYGRITSGFNGASVFLDDAYYYLITARNAAQAGLVSFDGVNTTTGFHPLWFALEWIAFKWAGVGSLNQQIGLVKSLEVYCLGASILLLLFASIRAFSINTGIRANSHTTDNQQQSNVLSMVLASVCVLYFLLRPHLSMFQLGMEASITVLFAIALLMVLEFNKHKWLLPCLVLLLWSRLDTVITVALPLCVVMWWSHPRKQWLTTFVGYSVAVAMTIAIYWFISGSISPISGQLKSSFPFIHFQPSLLWDAWVISKIDTNYSMLFTPSTLQILLGTVLLITLTFLHRYKSRNSALMRVSSRGDLGQNQPPDRIRMRFSGFFSEMPISHWFVTAVLVMHIINWMCFQKWTKILEQHYLAIATVFLIYGLVRISSLFLLQWFGSSRSSHRQLQFVSLASLAMMSLTFVQHALTVREIAAQKEMVTQFEGVRFIKANTQPTDRLAATDAGAIAFWCERQVVNLDGLINNLDYQRALRDQKLATYLDEQHVKYLVFPMWSKAQTLVPRSTEPMYEHRIQPKAQASKKYDAVEFFVYSHKYGVYSDKLTLTPAQEIYREYVGRDGTAETSIVIFKR